MILFQVNQCGVPAIMNNYASHYKESRSSGTTKQPLIIQRVEIASPACCGVAMAFLIVCYFRDIPLELQKKSPGLSTTGAGADYNLSYFKYIIFFDTDTPSTVRRYIYIPLFIRSAPPDCIGQANLYVPGGR